MPRLPVILSLLLLTVAGCKSAASLPSDARTREADRQAMAKWGKGLDDLPRVKLVLVSPHNENITQEFGWAFALRHAVEKGELVEFEWRDVGGGGSAIQQYLTNIYKTSDTADIDVLWGGGDIVFNGLLKKIGANDDGVLQTLDLPKDVLDNVPAELHGQRFYDPKKRWIGSAVSGFGFLYNAQMCKQTGRSFPSTWTDLGDGQFTDLLVLADPGQSGSVTATYMTIVQTEGTWPAGWAKLLGILSNAKRIADSAGSSANAPVLGDALVAACIDFYGLLRVAEAPDKLVYVSPEKQTIFGPDPIGILKNPPHPELAKEFVDYVMSAPGQAMWALRVGEKDGSVRSVLGRQPIRRDVYELYAGKMSPRIVNPFAETEGMTVATAMKKVSFGAFRQLVVSAAVDNIDTLRQARKRLNELAADPSKKDLHAQMLAEFNTLPANVATLEAMAATDNKLRDAVEFYNISKGWRDEFRAKFERIAAAK